MNTWVISTVKMVEFTQKNIVLFIVACFFSLAIQAQKIVFLSGEDASTAVDWEFMISEGRNSGFWTSIPVPSNWEAEGFGYYLYGMDQMDNRALPIGYYKHSFDWVKQDRHRYFIVFQAVMTDTKLSLNGKEIGFHQGGFTEFKFEITDYIQSGKNLLEVEVNSSSTNASLVEAERYADYWMFSGIFRPVYIQEVPREYIEQVAIDARMTGDLKMWVYSNGNDHREASSLYAQVYDAAGKRVGDPFSQEISGEKTLLSAHIPEVELWSHEFPHLYTMEVQLRKEDKVLHTYQQKFGFRTFEVRDHDGFYLNGKRILLKGASLNSFRPETGRALSKADMEENLHLMKELNFNCVRASHYPADAYFLELCDSLGMMAMVETTGWYRPLETNIGSQLVEEMVRRDVNHPSVVLWSNGNHMAHNPALDPVFFKWDIQERRPLKNEAKSNDIFANYQPDWDIINTTYYPNFATIKKNLFEENHIYLPNETLHALYDGGGGANLKTYWDLFEQSKVGGGLMIWALFDEGLMRTDMAYTADNQQNKAADGILGPHGEKEGSYYAVREIWSPVQIALERLGEDFEGEVSVENKFTFTDLNQCTLIWKLINFANPDGSLNGHRAVAEGMIEASLPAGETGKLSINLPSSFIHQDALAIEVYDPHGLLVYEKRLPISSSNRPRFRASVMEPFTQDPGNNFSFHRGDLELTFDSASGLLESVSTHGKTSGINNFPYLAFEAADSTLVNDISTSNAAKISQDGDKWIIESTHSRGFDYLRWELNAGGEITLDYAYTLNEGAYHYAGIGMEVPAKEVLRKRWLGEGPARIWKNRSQGGLWDVYALEKQVNVPGLIYNSIEFEGFFAPWNWAVFYLENNVNLGFLNNSDLTLGVLNPVNGPNHKFANGYYPKREGFFFFDFISPVGSKWKAASEFGPDAQPSWIKGQIKGSVSLFINWNRASEKAKRVDVEIE
ncbi:beta-galactosidase [Echinicola pacifica]|uniref:beta-galactosidase n=2 Tax=Echinicola pacifica TaxID=346377 RepID=A0A918PYK8_9BACT|nr:beta-galactosidase [Echinicola pacifica]